MERILVSACLLGSPVRYDGAAKTSDAEILRRWRAEGRLVPVCPEVNGGLAVPRPPAEIAPGARAAEIPQGRGQVLTDRGDDVTAAFVRGAELALSTAERSGARMAVLKDASPSCGSTRVYDGTFTGRSVPGAGVTTALLESHGIRVFDERSLPEAAAYLRRLETTG